MGHDTMDYTYTYPESEISHTLARVGDTAKWSAALSILSSGAAATNGIGQRQLVMLDMTVLEIEMKKATVTKNELETNLTFRNTLVQIATRPPDLLPDNRRWHFKERAMSLCLYFWGSLTTIKMEEAAPELLFVAPSQTQGNHHNAFSPTVAPVVYTGRVGGGRGAGQNGRRK